MNREVIVRDSSHIKRVAWDYETNTLVVEFNIGSVYRYNYVGPLIFGALISSASVGRYFSDHIRFNSSFPYEQIGGWPVSE